MAKVNGVDIESFKQTCGLIKQDPELAKSQFRVQNKWISGGNSQIHIQGFYGAKQEQPRNKGFEFQADEPPLLLGQDKGANPVEFLLTALSSCMTTSIIYHAANQGIKIDSISSDFKGDLDLQGFLNLSDKVPKGYEKIQATFHVKTEAPIEKIEEFYKFSPVYSMISKAVPIEVKVVKSS